MRGLATSAEIRKFLEVCWQQQPLLMRQALPSFEPPFDGDDLAGLACEPNVEARLVRGTTSQGFSVRHGPFTDELFETLTGNDWTLLVQDVDKFSEEVAQLWQHLSFLPRWRLDDIMISFSAAGGGVGPHEDQYDVFLLQAAGTRRWQWAKEFDPTLRAGEMKVLERFEAEEEAVLQPGDVLYLPPGVAHHGVSLEPGLTYSFGFRSPSQRELAIRLADEVVDRASPELRVCDAKRTAVRDAAYFPESDRAQLRSLIRAALHLGDDALDEVLAGYLTHPKDNLEQSSEARGEAMYERYVAPRLGTRWLYWAASDGHRFCIEGETFGVPSAVADELCPLCNGSPLEPARLSAAAQVIVQDWWRRGHLESHSSISGLRPR